jgi:hypothetical protein
MPTNKIEPSKITPPSAPAALDETRGCATSFLTSERNEMDTVCGGIQATQQEEYIQPDGEKEAGGES